MFYDRLKKACKNANTTITATLKAIGIGTANGTYWKNGSAPSSDVIVKLSEFLGVSTDYLLIGKESAEIDTSPDVIELISAYNSVDIIAKTMIKERALTLAELAAEQKAKNQEAEQNQKVKEIPLVAANEQPDLNDQEPEDDEYYIDLCSLPASAGSGVQLDEGFTEPLRIKRTSIAERANYAVRVFGNSMEPKYFDGDIVLIETCPIVEIGEIGIFIVDDQGYIKKRGEDRLISLNPEYDDVFVQNWNTTYCRGRVLGKAEVID